jgi:hypothetical protein
MALHLLVLALVGLLPGVESSADACIQGKVVNGSKAASPVPGAEVVLLAGKDDQFRYVASATADQNGCFVFDRRAVTPSPDLVHGLGANKDGIHYPGPRFRLHPDGPAPRVTLTVYDAVGAPCPLVAEIHEIDIHVNAGVLDVTEIIVVDNPSLSTYVGTGDPDAPKMAPTTLSLSIPEGVSHVTFNKEFDGRNFRFIDGRVVTSVPWPPGKRQLAFRYQVEVKNDHLRFARPLDLPCLNARIAVAGQRAEELVCNLPKLASANGESIAFQSNGKTLPAGHTLELQMGQLPVSWMVRARWATLIVVGGPIAVGAAYLFLRKRARSNRMQPANGVRLPAGQWGSADSSVGGIGRRRM